MAPLAPFEHRPRLAVAVSGGPDSLALCLLADRWARSRGGTASGLIVDHGLRAAAAAEAAQAAGWLAARGIAPTILRWTGPKPAAGIQAAARRARYDLLAAWCRAMRVLHLLLGHHRDDQVETVALRVERASGADGLAGMAAVREIAGLRLLRPLLDVPKSALIALLEAERQPWLDDPSNRAPAFARSRLRAGLPLDGGALGQLAQARASERVARDRATASWLARHARIDGAGFVLLDRPALGDALPELAQRVLQQTLLAVGGGDYAPRRVRLDRLLAGLRAGAGKRGWTLAGCRLLPRAGRLLVCREAGVVSEVLAAQAGRWQRWDRRFVVQAGGPGGGLEIRALGVDGWRQARRADAQWRDLPAPVGPGLPALWRGAALLALPRLAPRVHDGEHAPTFEARFRPHHPLSGAPFAPGLPYDAATRGEEIFASGVG